MAPVEPLAPEPEDAPGSRRGARVLGVRIDALGWDETLRTLSRWAAQRAARTVCLCNAHSLVSAARDHDFARTLADADLCLPDGAPLAWRLRQLGFARQPRIGGPDLMARYLALAAEREEPIYLYGGRPLVLEQLATRLVQRWPRLAIAGRFSPPFRPLTPVEEDAAADRIAASGAGTVWVALGCPHQERWMARMRARIPAVMLGVGAAFDFHAGAVRRAPAWMQRTGLEWLHRAAQDPRRLGRRYLLTQPRFAAGLLAEMLQPPQRHRVPKRDPAPPPQRP